jgi:hypothetical protein
MFLRVTLKKIQFKESHFERCAPRDQRFFFVTEMLADVLNSSYLCCKRCIFNAKKHTAKFVSDAPVCTSSIFMYC